MKSYIVSASMLIILIFFIFQWVSNESAHFKRTMLINVVEHHAQQARIEGYFTAQIKASLIKEVEEKIHVPNADIKLTVTETKVCTRESFDSNNQISYKVQIPIKNVVALAGLFNLEDSNNMYWFTLEDKVSSEKLCSP